MIIFTRKKKRTRSGAYVTGAGILDWLGNLGAKAANFIGNNSSLIKGVASTVADVGKAGASTVSSVKQIIDLARARKAAPVSATQPQGAAPVSAPVSPALQADLDQKSVDILNKLLVSSNASTSAGAGVYLGKQSDGWGQRPSPIGRGAKGRGVYLGKKSDGWGACAAGGSHRPA